jgi:hypothetical protein
MNEYIAAKEIEKENHHDIEKKSDGKYRWQTDN